MCRAVLHVHSVQACAHMALFDTCRSYTVLVVRSSSKKGYGCNIAACAWSGGQCGCSVSMPRPLSGDFVRQAEDGASARPRPRQANLRS